MKVAATNINALALADMISTNECLTEITIDLDLELIDENMVTLSNTCVL